MKAWGSLHENYSSKNKTATPVTKKKDLLNISQRRVSFKMVYGPWDRTFQGYIKKDRVENIFTFSIIHEVKKDAESHIKVKTSKCMERNSFIRSLATSN